MWTSEEIEGFEAGESYCEVCGERDVNDALIPVYVATAEWHVVEKLCHPECRELFVKANLPAVLESLRLVEMARAL